MHATLKPDRARWKKLHVPRPVPLQPRPICMHVFRQSGMISESLLTWHKRCTISKIMAGMRGALRRVL